MSDIDTAVVDSLKVLDPERPIREADIANVDHERLCALAHDRAGQRNSQKGKTLSPLLRSNCDKSTFRAGRAFYHSKPTPFGGVREPHINGDLE